MATITVTSNSSTSTLGLQAGDILRIEGEGTVVHVDETTPLLASIEGDNSTGHNLIVDEDVVLNCAGNLHCMNSGMGASTGTITMGPGSTIQGFTATASLRPNANSDASELFIFNGTALKPCVIDGGGYASIGTFDTSLSGTYVELVNVVETRTGLSFEIDGIDFDSDCGTWIIRYIGATENISVKNFRHHSTGLCLDIQNITDPSGAESRIIDGIVLDGSIVYDNCASMTWENFYAHNGFADSGTGYKGIFLDGWLICDKLESFYPTNVDDSVKGCFLDSLDFSNTHDIGGKASLNVTDCVFSSSAPITLDLGDCISAPSAAGGESATPAKIKGCISLIPDAIFLTMFAHPTLQISVTNCTILRDVANQDAGGVNVGETDAIPANCLTWTKNIVVGRRQIQFQPGATVADGAITADWNCTTDPNDEYTQSTQLAKYTSTSGVNDVNEDPAFVDDAATLDTYAVSLGCDAGETRLNKRAYVQARILDGTIMPSDIVSYIRAAYTPTNMNLKLDVGYIGAVEPVASFMSCTIELNDIVDTASINSDYVSNCSASLTENTDTISSSIDILKDLNISIIDKKDRMKIKFFGSDKISNNQIKNLLIYKRQ